MSDVGIFLSCHGRCSGDVNVSLVHRGAGALIVRCPSVACPHLERGLYKLVVGVNAGLFPGPTTPNGTCGEVLVTDQNIGPTCVSWRINCGPMGCLYDLAADETEHGASRATMDVSSRPPLHAHMIHAQTRCEPFDLTHLPPSPLQSILLRSVLCWRGRCSAGSPSSP